MKAACNAGWSLGSTKADDMRHLTPVQCVGPGRLQGSLSLVLMFHQPVPDRSSARARIAFPFWNCPQFIMRPVSKLDLTSQRFRSQTSNSSVLFGRFSWLRLVLTLITNPSLAGLTNHELHVLTYSLPLNSIPLKNRAVAELTEMVAEFLTK